MELLPPYLSLVERLALPCIGCASDLISHANLSESRRLTFSAMLPPKLELATLATGFGAGLMNARASVFVDC